MADYRIAEILSGLLPVVVILREHEELRFLEIRLYKKNLGTEQLSPTNWAVGLDARSFSELKTRLDESYEYIQAWFGPREVDTIERVHINMVTQTKANENAARMAHMVDVKHSAWNGPTFFSTRSEGDRTVIELNSQNPIVSKITSANPGQSNASTSQILSTILAAYHDAKNRFVGEEKASAINFFRAFEYEWGIILNRYAGMCS